MVAVSKGSPPGGGWVPIGTHGGYRKGPEGHYEYWYPGAYQDLVDAHSKGSVDVGKIEAAILHVIASPHDDKWKAEAIEHITAIHAAKSAADDAHKNIHATIQLAQDAPHQLTQEILDKAVVHVIHGSWPDHEKSAMLESLAHVQKALHVHTTIDEVAAGLAKADDVESAVLHVIHSAWSDDKKHKALEALAAVPKPNIPIDAVPKDAHELVPQKESWNQTLWRSKINAMIAKYSDVDKNIRALGKGDVNTNELTVHELVAIVDLGVRMKVLLGANTDHYKNQLAGIETATKAAKDAVRQNLAVLKIDPGTIDAFIAAMDAGARPNVPDGLIPKPKPFVGVFEMADAAAVSAQFNLLNGTQKKAHNQASAWANEIPPGSHSNQKSLYGAWKKLVAEHGEPTMVEFERIVKTAEVTVQFPWDKSVGGKTVLDSILDDGRVKTLFETGHGQGGSSTSPRHTAERGMFGSSYDSGKPHDRPVYGSINVGNNMHGGTNGTSYGSAYFVLKQEVSQSRVTYSYGDSFGFMSEKGAMPPSKMHLVAAYGAKQAGIAASGSAKDKARAMANVAQNSSYLEAQVHGGIQTARDIHALVMPSKSQGTKQWDRALAYCKQHGIEMRVKGPSKVSLVWSPGGAK